MGEIADALRRAREAGGTRAAEPARRAPERQPEGPVYSRAIDVEAPDRSAPAAPPLPRDPGAAADAARAAGTADADVRIDTARRGHWAARAVVAERDGPRAEAYRHFAIRLARELERKRVKSVMIVSALRLEGKTTTACNLALAYASMSGGRRTALIDLDLRRPSVAGALGIEPRRGIEQVVAGRAPLDEARLRTDLPFLDVYPAAAPLDQPHRELSHPRLGEVLAELERRYETIVIDSAPMLLVPDAELLLPHVGGAVAVLRARQTRREAFRKLSAMIPDGLLLGSFMNDCRAARHSRQYGYYRDERRPADAPAEGGSIGG